MNFEQCLFLPDGVSCVCSSAILLILSIAAYIRTKDWGFFCWICSSSCVLLSTILWRTGTIVRYNGVFYSYFVTVLVFTFGVVRIIRQYLHLFAASRPPGYSRSTKGSVT
jgi:hypothetical protein